MNEPSPLVGDVGGEGETVYMWGRGYVEIPVHGLNVAMNITSYKKLSLRYLNAKTFISD